jgi:hypothetical protein
MDATTIAKLINNSGLELEFEVTPENVEFCAHPVIPDTYGVVITGEDGSGFLIQDGEVTEASDTFYGEAKFLAVTVQAGDRPFIDVSEEGGDPTLFTCFNKWDYTAQQYEPTKFKVGEEVYPLFFHANIPGGWTVVNASGISEYWQCE